MSGGTRRGGIPGPESRTGLVRPAMTEAEFERRQGGAAPAVAPAEPTDYSPPPTPEADTGPRASAAGARAPAADYSPPPAPEADTGPRASAAGRGRAPRAKPTKPRRVQRMFAIEEELDKKLWLYAIHVGKDRSEVVNDLLRPLVASMVLYDSRDRRNGRNTDPGLDRSTEMDGESAACSDAVIEGRGGIHLPKHIHCPAKPMTLSF